MSNLLINVLSSTRHREFYREHQVFAPHAGSRKYQHIRDVMCTRKGTHLFTFLKESNEFVYEGKVVGVGFNGSCNAWGQFLNAPLVWTEEHEYEYNKNGSFKVPYYNKQGKLEKTNTRTQPVLINFQPVKGDFRLPVSIASAVAFKAAGHNPRMNAYDKGNLWTGSPAIAKALLTRMNATNVSYDELKEFKGVPISKELLDFVEQRLHNVKVPEMELDAFVCAAPNRVGIDSALFPSCQEEAARSLKSDIAFFDEIDGIPQIIVEDKIELDPRTLNSAIVQLQQYLIFFKELNNKSIKGIVVGTNKRKGQRIVVRIVDINTIYQDNVIEDLLEF